MQPFDAGAFSTNSAFWSLKWEVLFSLLLPFFTSTMLVLRRHTLLLFLALMALSASTEIVHAAPEAIQLFPMFAIGIILAIELPRIQIARRAVAAKSRLLWPALGVFALCALTAHASLAPLFQGLTPRAGRFAAAGGSLLTTLGATLVVILTISWDGWRSQMEYPPWQWLGRYSYSLYLVHEPVVVCVAFALGITTNPVPVLILGVPLSVVVAMALYHTIELPSMKLAGRVGRRCADLGRVAG